MDKVKTLGQVYTPPKIVEHMVEMIQNKGNILEPSCGDGAFVKYIKEKFDQDPISIELDPENSQPGVMIMDFFDYDTENKFNTIIGNPPYVAYKRLSPETLSKIQKTDYLEAYPNRTNLYIYFIRKCLEHLSKNGELIFITPREFINSTSSIKMNEELYEMGTITHWFEYGDSMLFKDHSPNVVIWRFQKDDFSRKTETNSGVKNFTLNNGHLMFIDNDYDVKFNDLFFVKVGAVSGMDSIFESEMGNQDFVCSFTKKTGKLKRMIYNIEHPHLENFKTVLINRKIRQYTEENWFMWGRGLYESNEPRIYVNCKTRDMKPFFTHDCNYYDGSILAIFPKVEMNIDKAVELLNNVDWNEMGFMIGKRLCFAQRALENSFLPHEFKSLMND